MSTNIKPQVNDMQDILLSSSTFPGYASYRDTVEGSWFIQELVGVFREQSDTEHVMDMLTEVNHRVSQKHTEMCAQMPFPSNSLTKRWYLNPPKNCQLVI
ncbi:non-catalytic caspase homolog csp-3-like [Saccostrea cucullata]